jgi:hypothetical protein
MSEILNRAKLVVSLICRPAEPLRIVPSAVNVHLLELELTIFGYGRSSRQQGRALCLGHL